MSKHQFKVGDKVKYNESNKQYAESNGHIADEVYTVSEIRDSLIYFDKPDEYGGGCLWYRLEHAKEETVPETFDYHQALKILAENPEAEIESKSEDMDWHNILLGKEFILYTNAIYRLKPQPKKYQWLYKTKVSGQYFTTSEKYASKEEAEEDHEGHNLIFIKALNEETL